MSAEERVSIARSGDRTADDSARALLRDARALLREGAAVAVPQSGGLVIRMPDGTPAEEMRELSQVVADALAMSGVTVTVTGAAGLQVVGLEWAVRHRDGFVAAPLTSLLAADMERLRADRECSLCSEPHKVVRRQVMDWEDASRDGDLFREAVEAANAGLLQPTELPAGFEIAAEAARAAAQGEPAKNRLFGNGFEVAFEVSENGAVTVLTDGYEAVIEDGFITSFRATTNDA